MTRSRNLILFSVCVGVSIVQGWLLLKVWSVGVWQLCLDIFGPAPFLLLGSVHGNAEALVGVIGGALFVLTNGAVYYGLVHLLLRVRRRRSA